MGLLNLIMCSPTIGALMYYKRGLWGIATERQRSLLRSYMRVALDNNDHNYCSCRVMETSLGGRHARHVPLCFRVVSLSHMSGQRNKRSRHGSVVPHSSHATSNKQITASCRFYVSPFDIAGANHSTPTACMLHVYTSWAKTFAIWSF